MNPVTPVPRLPQPHFGWAILWTVLLAASQAVMAFCVAAPIIVIAVIAHRDLEVVQQELLPLLVPLGTLATLVTALLVTALMFRGRFRQCLGLRWPTAFQTVLVGLLAAPLAVVASEIGNCVTDLLSRHIETTGLETGTLEVIRQFGSQPWWLILLSACLFPAVGEEMFFRGFLGRGLVARHGPWWGVIGTSVLFAVIHVHPAQVCGTFFLGAALHLVFLATRSLPAAMLLHALNNSLAFATMKWGDRLAIPGLTETDGAVAHTPWPLLAVAMLTAAGLLTLLFRCRTRWLVAAEPWTPGYVSGELPPRELAAHPVAHTSLADYLAAILLLGLFLGTLKQWL